MTVQGQSIMSQAVISLLDIYKPQVDDKFYMKYLYEDGLLDYMEMMGQTLGVKGDTFEHWEEVPAFAAVSSNTSQSAPAAGAAITITLSSADHTQSGTLSQPQVGQLVHFLRSGVSGYITAVNKATPSAHTFTAYPNESTATFGAVTAGDKIVCYSNAYAEGSGQPGGYIPQVAKLTYGLQMQKATLEVTGSEFGNETWVSFPDGKGGTGNYAIYKGEYDTAIRFKRGKEMNLILTPTTTNTTITALGIQTSEGLMPWIENNGGIVSNYTQGSLTYENLKAYTKRFNKRNLKVNEFMLKAGIDFQDEVNTFLRDDLKNGAVSYGAFNGKKDLAVAMNYNSFSDLGYTYHISNYRPFDDENTLGADGSQYPGYAIVCPIGKTQDKLAGAPTNFMRLRYKDGNGWNRKHFSWTDGVSPTTKIGQYDKFTVNHVSHEAPEWFCPQAWGIFKRVTA